MRSAPATTSSRGARSRDRAANPARARRDLLLRLHVPRAVAGLRLRVRVVGAAGLRTARRTTRAPPRRLARRARRRVVRDQRVAARDRRAMGAVDLGHTKAQEPEAVPAARALRL